MGQNSFTTLDEFIEAVPKTKVTLREGNEISLNEGLSTAVEYVKQVANSGKKVMLIGNGGSAAIASHQAIDLWKNGGIRATAFNDPSLLTCISNDYSYSEVFSKPIEMFADEGDLLIAVSSSGKSENILNGVKAARSRNCPVIGLSGFKAENPLRRQGDLNFYIESMGYGVVEVGHLLLIHAFIDKVIELRGT